MKTEELTGELLSQWETYSQEVEERNRQEIEGARKRNLIMEEKHFKILQEHHTQVDEEEKQYQQALEIYHMLPWYRKRRAKKPEEPWIPFPYSLFSAAQYIPWLQDPTWEGFLTWLAKKR